VETGIPAFKPGIHRPGIQPGIKPGRLAPLKFCIISRKQGKNGQL
jgi:hypothetical protein